MKIVIVTGMSGAGKRTALKVLEDAGYYCVDNLPVELVLKFVELAMASSRQVNIAIGVDVRVGDTFSDLTKVLERMQHRKYEYEVLFLDADDEVLVKRYKETRRNHPLAGDHRVIEGIQKEREELAFIKDKADYIIDVLVGKETDEVIAHKHADLDCFGCGDEHEEKFWNAVIRQALIAGYLEKEIENYGILKLTAKGRKFMKKPESFMVSEDNEFEDDDEEVVSRSGGGTGVTDPALFNALLDLRKKMSKNLNVPPYVIFQDPSLEAMATMYPVSIEELQNIPGVGAGKAKRYGKEFCDLIRQHCEEYEIERPEDLRVRTVANKSKLKVSIIQSIDRKVALDDIATSSVSISIF